MPEISPAQNLLSRLAPVVSKWKRDSLDEWLTLNPPHIRVSLSSTERNRFIFDRTMARAEAAVLPVALSKVHTDRGLKSLHVVDENVGLAIWFKKIDPQTFLTSNYPTPTAQDRQKEPYLPYEDMWAELWVCGHTLIENLAGDEVEMSGIYFTQERTTENGKRFVSESHRIYSSARGNLAMPTHEQLRLWQSPPMMPERPTIIPPVVRARIRPAEPAVESEMPKVGIDQPKRAAEKAAARKKKDSADGA